MRQVGSGGMGVVWQAYDERLHRKVAVKQLLMPPELTGPQTAEARRLAMREGRNAAKLQHPHSIAVYDVVEDGGQSYLIMEYLPSLSLAQRLGERGPLPPEEVAAIGAQVAAALVAAQSAGVVHRDIKPGNVLLSTDGTAKITDFGISRAVEDVTATATGLLAGTPAYLSPEVAQGLPATYQSDVFSLGATLYTAVEGAPPAGSTENAMAMLYRVASAEFAPPKQAGRMTGLLVEMLNPDPSRRPTMAQVKDRLDALSGQPKTPPPTRPVDRPAPPPEPVEPEPARPNRRRTAILAGAALVVLALIGTLVAWSLAGDEPGGQTAAPQTTTTPASTSQPAPPSSSPPQATSAPAPPARQDPGRTPADTITGYYALMPGDLPQAWTWLTPKYRQHPAGGYGGYQTFWARVSTVRVFDVSSSAANTVDASVDYSFKDGRLVRERHRYTLINQDNRWLIDQSVVLSSQTL